MNLSEQLKGLDITNAVNLFVTPGNPNKVLMSEKGVIHKLHGSCHCQGRVLPMADALASGGRLCKKCYKPS